MSNIQVLSDCAMQVISYAGMAKSNYLEALHAFQREEEFENLIEQGDQNFQLAHQAHISVLNEEMSSETAQISLLLAHAEDQLMAAETIKILVLELIKMGKKKG